MEDARFYTWRHTWPHIYEVISAELIKSQQGTHPQAWTETAFCIQRHAGNSEYEEMIHVSQFMYHKSMKSSKKMIQTRNNLSEKCGSHRRTTLPFLPWPSCWAPRFLSRSFPGKEWAPAALRLLCNSLTYSEKLFLHVEIWCKREWE